MLMVLVVELLLRLLLLRYRQVVLLQRYVLACRLLLSGQPLSVGWIAGVLLAGWLNSLI